MGVEMTDSIEVAVKNMKEVGAAAMDYLKACKEETGMNFSLMAYAEDCGALITMMFHTFLPSEDFKEVMKDRMILAVGSTGLGMSDDIVTESNSDEHADFVDKRSEEKRQKEEMMRRFYEMDIHRASKEKLFVRIYTSAVMIQHAIKLIFGKTVKI
jgi:hypothetical protein